MAGAVRHQGHGAADPADAGDDGRDHRLPGLQPARADTASGSPWPSAGSSLGRGIRGFSHLRRHPGTIFLLPLVALVVILIALPIKLYAFVTMNKQGWLTRTDDQIGGDGQTASRLIGAEANGNT